MSSIRYNALYVKRAVTGAIQALDAIASADDLEPNDLIAGALALDQLASHQEHAEQAKSIAAELRRLATDVRYRNSRSGTELYNLVDLLRTIRRLVTTAGAEGAGDAGDGPALAHRYTHGTGRGDFLSTWDEPPPYAHPITGARLN